MLLLSLQNEKKLENLQSFFAGGAGIFHAPLRLTVFMTD